MISILTPAFNESANLEALYERLVAAMAAQAVDWEWVVVDDHSRDDTFGVIQRLASRDPRVRGVRLSRNSGSHLAIMCGLHHVSGEAAAFLAADLQNPPELLGEMIARWRAGAQVVWAVRRQRPNDPHQHADHKRSAAIYYWVMRELVGMRDMPANGGDFFLIDRVVVEAFRQSQERNTSVFALITWLGFRQDQIEYDRGTRVAGTSGWTLARKITLVVDSVTSFSDFPLRWCLYGGVALIAAGLVAGTAGLWALPRVGPGLWLVAGLILVLSGMQLLALAIVGQYVYRALDEARGRPRYVIEAVAGRLAAPQPAVE